MKQRSHPRLHDLREPEDLPLFRCRDATPRGADGAAWEAAVIRLAHELHARAGVLRPSQLRAAAEARGLVPHHPNRWGVVFSKLRACGWERTADEAVSATATRNAARESVWRRP
jgi:hypothetical protein